jgi:hypothetical protein
MMVITLSELKREVGWAYSHLCESVGLSYASFRRWQHRLEHGQSAIFKPGPQKVAPLNLEELRVALYHLKHGRQRSRGVSGLYRQQQDQISRRDLQVLTRAVRWELAHQHQAELRHITWKIPGLVWSGRWMTRSWRGSPTTPGICIKCKTSPRATSSRPGWESTSWERPWLFTWSNCSCRMDRRWCSNATMLPTLSILGPQQRSEGFGVLPQNESQDAASRAP